MVTEKLVQNNFQILLRLLFVFTKVLVIIEIEVKFPKVRNNVSKALLG